MNNTPAANLRKSFATLRRHRDAGRLDRRAALRLLENNARDFGLRSDAAQTQALEWFRDL